MAIKSTDEPSVKNYFKIIVAAQAELLRKIFDILALSKIYLRWDLKWQPYYSGAAFLPLSQQQTMNVTPLLVKNVF